MTDPTDDERTLARLGYRQELHRGLGAFSNYALSLSIICILAGGVTSFPIGLASVGGASIGLGWPMACLFSLVVALTMAQVASAFPTAGGLYHWASILGGKGWGWLTAWLNLAGLVTVLSAINFGMVEFTLSITKPLGLDLESPEAKTIAQIGGVLVVTLTQAFINDRGIRLTARLTDFSGWWILAVALVLTVAVLAFAPAWDFSRLLRFDNFSGLPEPPIANDPVWPRQEGIAWLFFLGLLLPAYTITGFDASAHAAEETRQASRHVPLGIVRSVIVSGVVGWLMLCAVVVAAPDLETAVRQGDSFVWILRHVLPGWLALTLLASIAVAQYLCGLATLTSASRMLYAFARDGGTVAAATLARVHPTRRVPSSAIWVVAVGAFAFTLYTPVYSTITAVCTLLLYGSYVLPTLLGLFAYGRSWTTMGPWSLGRWYRPLAILAVVGCIGLFVIGIQPPNEKVWKVLVTFVGVLTLVWVFERKRFAGPRRGET